METDAKRGLLDVRRFVIPTVVVVETIQFLRQVGTEGLEGFVLWSGQHAEMDTFRILRCIVPKQRGMKTPNGLLVTVDGETLFAVNKLLHEVHEILAVQVHSHPTDAYHSSTDDTFPLVTLVGALSVVIPEFATNAPHDLEDWAWYRLSSDGEWVSAATTTEVEFV